MKKRIIVLSLFDGIGAGREAFKRSGTYVKYYASEINLVAMRVALKNHPDIIQVGNVCDLNPWDFRNVDVIIGGSPCQSISRAGKVLGITTKSGIVIRTLEQYMDLKARGVEMNESALFWEFIRMYRGIQQYNPNVKFFLENVTNKYWEDFITSVLEVAPRMINSSTITGQNRERNYWTDIPMTRFNDYGLTIGHYIPGAVTGAGIRGVPRKDWTPESGVKKYKGNLTFRKDNKANCVTCSYSSTGKYLDIHGEVKQITPDQAELLQSFTKGYTKLDGIPDSQRFKMIGNSWTVDVIVKFFENLKLA
jgi:site-specific DNA-cytosine methylase